MKIRSRHRLPSPYRSLLCGLWLTPQTILLITALILTDGPRWTVAHPITLLVLLISSFPAWYVWNEGVDVMDDRLRIRIGGFRVREFDQLAAYHIDHRNPNDTILTVWDFRHMKVIDTHAAHLTEFGKLAQTLKQHAQPRGWR